MESEIYHHGIKGQKWGIRRFQPYPKGEKPQGAKEIGRANKFASKVENSKLAKKLGESANKKVKNSKVTNNQIERVKAMRSRIEKSSFFKNFLTLALSQSMTGSIAVGAAFVARNRKMKLMDRDELMRRHRRFTRQVHLHNSMHF